MRVQHLGRQPEIDASAWVAPGAVISGAVQIGPDARVMWGAVLTAELGAELVIGAGCVIMEQAVIRASGPFSTTIGERVLVGPHAYVTGCRIGPFSFIATGAMVFNGASLGEACIVALGGMVHIDTVLEPGTRIPIGFIAIGRPATIYSPERAPEVHDELARVDFMHYVFGVDTADKERREIMDMALRRYGAALGSHRDDVVIDHD